MPLVAGRVKLSVCWLVTVLIAPITGASVTWYQREVEPSTTHRMDQRATGLLRPLTEALIATRPSPGVAVTLTVPGGTAAGPSSSVMVRVSLPEVQPNL